MRAFTLIDVLVTIAIVGVLVGLVLPALSKSLQASRATACMSNLRQIHFGMMMYVDEYQYAPIWNEYPDDDERAAIGLPDSVWLCKADPDKGVNRRGGHTSYDASGFRKMRYHSLKHGDIYTQAHTNTLSLAVAWDYNTCHGGKRNRMYVDGTVRQVP